MKKLRYIIIVLVLLFSMAWSNSSFLFFLFVVFIPLFWIEENSNYGKNLQSYFVIIYLFLVTCNAGVVYWIFKINITGGILTCLINPLIFTLPFLVYKYLKNKEGLFIGQLAFIITWISLEYLHFRWELAFPYLTLGYGLARFQTLIQWYEYTGVLGGTLWILLMNVSAYNCLKSIISKQKAIKQIVYITVILTLPILVSKILFSTYEEKGKQVNFLVLHPNTDCYNYKYTRDKWGLVEDYIKTISPYLNKEIDYILWPETAITNKVWYNEANDDLFISAIKDLVCTKGCTIRLISGALIDERVEIDPLKNSSKIPHLKYNRKEGIYYYSYNAAIQIDCQTSSIPIHTKQKLVPFEETVPYPNVLLFLSKYIGSLGGFKFSARGDVPTVFYSKDSSTRVAPLICYESLFGEATTEYVKAGANILSVSLNEGWYKNLTAASHFVSFSIVRAIENRRSVARSSNDGISCLINQKGEIIKARKEFKPGVIKGTLRANNEITFYSRNGDWIGVICIVLCAILFVRFSFLLYIKNLKTK